MTVHGAARARTGPTPPPAWQPRTDPAPLLPDAEPYRVLGTDAAAGPTPRCCAGCTRELVRGRRYNAQATALTKQGRLAVYPSSTGQEACEVAAALVAARSGTGSSPATATPSPPSPAASTPSRR